ncbi:MAG TPA: cytochrome C oxidase subunit IV family protein [Azospirillum sp.]
MAKSINRLTLAWLFLLALSVTTLVVGGAASREPLGVAGAAGVLLAALFKGREILLHYLELKHAGRGWRVVLTAYLLLIAALVLLAYAAGHLGWMTALRR